MALRSLACLLTLGLPLLVAPHLAEAQQSAKIPRIGVLTDGPNPRQRLIDTFRKALHALGYIEGQTIAFVWRFAETPAQYPALAAELVDLQVDLIVTTSGSKAVAAKQATSTIPIVMGDSADPVASGLVASLAHPEGNITGFASFSAALSPKALELLKETLPGLTRVAVLRCAQSPRDQQVWEDLQRTAQRLGLHLQSLEVRRATPEHFQALFAVAVRERAEAVQTLDCKYTNSATRTQVTSLATKHRLPGMYHFRGFVRAGGLMAYTPNYADRGRRVASYVDKILQGMKPADLPVEQPFIFQLLINLKTAKALGLTIPPMVLFQADEVIR